MTDGRTSIIIARLVALGVVAVVAAACGGGGGGGGPEIGTGAESVTGFLVVHRDVRAGAEDALGPLPAEAGGIVNQGFDQALAHANWAIAGEQQHGVTGPDGRFVIDDLEQGRYAMHVTKTVGGDLIDVGVPIAVGDNGGAEVVGEVALGRVRSTSTYERDGVQIEETSGPNGTRLVTGDGRVIELSDGNRTLVDVDGDGQFDVDGCSEEVWSCEEGLPCDDGRTCQCTASCPFCEDCGPPVCVLPWVFPSYACNDDGSCALPSDRCVCVGSCQGCDDCPTTVCVPRCEPVEIVAVSVYGPSQLVVGQEGAVFASATLSDGSVMEVTWLAEWESSNPSVAEVDAWGIVSAREIGSTTVTATLDSVRSEPWAIDVVERPRLHRIHVQNLSCYYPLGVPTPDGFLDPDAAPPFTEDLLPPPDCGHVVRIGAMVPFVAFGEFENGAYEEITNEVTWRVVPAEIGDVVNGLFTARQEGTAAISASLDEVVSDPVEIRVVSEPTVVYLSIYPENWAYPVFDGGPILPGADVPCFDCAYGLTILRGDEVQFRATAHYDTGEWEDVTEQVTWRTSDPVVTTIDSTGVMTGVDSGEASIDAILDEVTSGNVVVRVVNEATLQSLYIYQEGRDRVLGKGDQVVFHAVGYYDVGFDRDVTEEATWRSSDEAIGGFDEPGIFTGRGAGDVTVWAELGDARSDDWHLEVFETSEIDYCDPDNVNRGFWADDFNRVVLESDCAEYTPPGVVTLRYTVTETRPHGGIFDPCLDLFVFQGDTRVRTIREEGCGEPFLPFGSPDFAEEVLRYQLLAFWDLKDEEGAVVPAGTYTIYGRFYLYYDPVVSLEVTVR